MCELLELSLSLYSIDRQAVSLVLVREKVWMVLNVMDGLSFGQTFLGISETRDLSDLQY